MFLTQKTTDSDFITTTVWIFIFGWLCSVEGLVDGGGYIDVTLRFLPLLKQSHVV